MTPTEFYREIRPEFFSDSEMMPRIILPREVLSFELNKISTNQKQDEFETLCRRLAEKFIAPNLIPQVGPTGGGDGKTDSETHPVSQDIANRWFTPENGWKKDEYWAFAISSKEDWKGKVRSDVKKIVDTKRGYSRIYFMSNQLIPNRKKKDIQDELIEKYKIDVIILDGEWILEKIYGNDLINLVVDSLNLSQVYKSEEVKLGSNDTRRQTELEELEAKIGDSNRYSSSDFQLVEDALRSAILSRMLEKPRDEIEGKFDRALRLGNEVGNQRQLMRIHYQKAWTYINWYDDYLLFIEEFNSFKTFISSDSNMSEIEDYFTLYTVLVSIEEQEEINLLELGIDIRTETKYIYHILDEIIRDPDRTTSSLMAKTHLLFLHILNHDADIDTCLSELSSVLESSVHHMDFPFESTQKIIEDVFSVIFPDNQEFDKLIDTIASISANRSSELEAGQIFFRRAVKKLQSNSNRDSIVYFGKSIMKIAKEEAQEHMYFALIGLGIAYRNLDLIWASNNSFITALHIAFNLSQKTGIISEKAFKTIKELLKNELFIGRLPFILTWHEISQIFQNALNLDESEEEGIPFNSLCDATLSTRILYAENTDDDILQYLPDIFEKQELWLSQDAALYKQGYVDLVIKDHSDISNEHELDQYFDLISNQPFVEQMLFKTDFMAYENLNLCSNLLGCEFKINYTKNVDMLLAAETLLAFFEAFMGTSLSNIHAHKESVIINIVQIKDMASQPWTYDEDLDAYNLSLEAFNVSKIDFDKTWKMIMELSIDILTKNFLLINGEEHFYKLFAEEEVNERASLVFGHRNSVLSSLGNRQKFFFDDWIKYYQPSSFIMKRIEPKSFEYKKMNKDHSTKYEKEDINELGHNKIKTHTIINMTLWDKAKWKGFGFIYDPNEESISVMLAFENADSAKKIFEEWKKRVGEIDTEELIGITIIKGVNKEQPHWYKVMVSINEKVLRTSASDRLMQVLSRFHLMTPNDSKNLNNLISGFNFFKKYKILPASMNDDGKVEPFFEYGITKASLIIKEAWEIGKNDLESTVIQKDDNPIIPNEHQNDAPILSILKDKRWKI